MRREATLNRALEVRTRGLVASLVHQGCCRPPTSARSIRCWPSSRRCATPSRRCRRRCRGPKSSTSRALARELEPGVLLLVLHLGQDQFGQSAFGWAVTGTSLRGRDLGSATDIRDLAAALHGLLAGTDPTYQEDFSRWSAQLAEKVYSPFATEIAAARQIVVVAPAELQRVPFAALPFPRTRAGPCWPRAAGPRFPPRASCRCCAGARRPGPRLPAAGDRRRPGLRRRFPAAGTSSPRRSLRAADRHRDRRQPTARPGRPGERLAADHRFRGQSGAPLGRCAGRIPHPPFRHPRPHRCGAPGPRAQPLRRSGKSDRGHFRIPRAGLLSLDADLVVTSACSSALGEQVAGEGLLGLTQGFLGSGVPRLLLTLWPVRGEPSRRLVDRFYRRLLGGEAPAEALRRTQLALYEEGYEVREWAAFELYGEWRPLPALSSRRKSTASRGACR